MNQAASSNPATELDRIQKILERLAACLELASQHSRINLFDLAEPNNNDSLSLLISAVNLAGMSIRELKLAATEVRDVLSEGMLVLCVTQQMQYRLLESLQGTSTESTTFYESVQSSSLTKAELEELIGQPRIRTFVITRELACETASSNSSRNQTDHSHSSHLSPIARFFAFLRLDQRDIWTVVLFALVNGILGLATPLAVEALVNVVSWGTILQPLLVLGIVLLVCLGLAGVLSILQSFIVEIIQRRQFVRIVADLAHRFPRANRAGLHGHYAREYANRIFDVMTIQKSTASLLLDGISIVLATVLGMTLLAFYHPFLLGFDLVLLLSMVSITWLLGRRGIESAIDESITKYKVVHWLQDVLASPVAFKILGGEYLAIEHANRLTTDYILARQKHFRVVIRQFAFAAGLQAIASAAILGLGGWLVIRQQLTLGQLVASELIVTVVVGAFSKAGKVFEKFYDLMAAIDKVGHLLDLPIDERQALGTVAEGPLEVCWERVIVANTPIADARIAAGRRVAVTGINITAKSQLLKSICGIHQIDQGSIDLNGIEARHVALSGRQMLGYAAGIEVIHASLATNISMGRPQIGSIHLRQATEMVELSRSIVDLKHGLETQLQSDGEPLSSAQQAQLMLARAIIGKPGLLIIDGLLDLLPEPIRMRVWNNLSNSSNPWTLIVATCDQQILGGCDQIIEIS